MLEADGLSPCLHSIVNHMRGLQEKTCSERGEDPPVELGPNAGPQPRLAAGARDELRLPGVGCRPLFGQGLQEDSTLGGDGLWAKHTQYPARLR
jgi:hypothetical protein